MRKLLIFVVVFTSFKLLSQHQRVKEKEVYICNNNKIRLVSNNELFSGTVEKVKNHQFIEYEEKFKDGVLMELNVFFRNSKKISDKYVYDPQRPLHIVKRIRYGHHDGWKQIVYLDDNEQTELIETYQDNKLTYSCEHSGRPKNGKEIFYANGAIVKELFYINGEEVKGVSVSSK